LRIARNLLLMVLVVLLLPYLLALLYRAGHPVSTLMAWRYLTGAPMSRQWIDLNAMSPALPRSVVASEDAKFCRHHGIDWDALREVIDDAEDGEVARGGSTITQQVAKNLFLWPGHSFVRKALEAYFTVLIEALWPKERILEMYLNVAQFGYGTYGVQAAAQRFWHTPARRLSSSEAALLAAVLPNPLRLRVDRPSRYVLARRDWILDQMRGLGGAGYLQALESERRTAR
jgi:monofunctional biosynthetic peptidoglycan transglycosylase